MHHKSTPLKWNCTPESVIPLWNWSVTVVPHWLPGVTLELQWKSHISTPLHSTPLHTIPLYSTPTPTTPVCVILAPSSPEGTTSLYSCAPVLWLSHTLPLLFPRFTPIPTADYVTYHYWCNHKYSALIPSTCTLHMLLRSKKLLQATSWTPNTLYMYPVYSYMYMYNICTCAIID